MCLCSDGHGSVGHKFFQFGHLPNIAAGIQDIWLWYTCTKTKCVPNKFFSVFKSDYGQKKADCPMPVSMPMARLSLCKMNCERCSNLLLPVPITTFADQLFMLYFVFLTTLQCRQPLLLYYFEFVLLLYMFV